MYVLQNKKHITVHFFYSTFFVETSLLTVFGRRGFLMEVRRSYRKHEGRSMFGTKNAGLKSVTKSGK